MTNVAARGEPPSLRIQLLGDFRVWIGLTEIDPERWRLRKSRTLLKLLALSPGHQLHRDQVMTLLWPEHDPGAAANNLHQTLYAARRILEPDTNTRHFLQLHDEILSLCPDAPLWIDVEAFETAAVEAHHSDDPATYQAAIDLYTGDLLPDDRYEEWVSPRRESLQKEYLRVLVELGRLYEGRSEFTSAIETFQQVLARDPAHEEAHVGLMRLHALSGQRQQALRQYETLHNALRRDLDAEPDSQSTRLYQDILAERFPPSGAGAKFEEELLIPGTLPKPRHNLPTPLTSFIGRPREIAEIQSLVTSHRLTTLIGAGGSGKTRLSLEVARAMLDVFSDGVWFVELASLSEPALVPQTIVSTLGLIEQRGRPALTILTDFLQAKVALLLLDNCEHLIRACAQLSEALLHACPTLHLLATSREALGVPGEVTFRVPSLSTPDVRQLPSLEALSQYEAVQLFIERAQTGQSGTAMTRENARAIAQVCHHLDGIPLAIELAAARAKVLRVEEIASRLDDRFHLLTGGSRTALPRYQTLQASIDWSYDLLAEPERVLLRRLSVFAGSWTLGSAEQVCADDPNAVPFLNRQGESTSPAVTRTEAGHVGRMDVLDLLSQLVNKSLVIVESRPNTETRYRLLETIRQYGREKLWASGEGETVRQWTLAYFLQLAERAEPQLRGPNQVQWLNRLEAERDNIRAALEGALESDVEAELRLSSALWWFWHIRGYKSEGTEWLERALAVEALERGEKPLWPERAMVRGKALNVAGFLRLMLGYDDATTALSEEALALFRELGPAGRRGMAYALLNLAGAAIGQEGYGKAQALMQESLALFREVGDKFGMAECIMNLSGSALDSGEVERARTLAEEHLALRQEIGDKDGMATALRLLGDIALVQGDHEQATEMFEASLSLLREVGNRSFSALVFSSLGEAALARGDYKQAAKQYEEAMALAREVGENVYLARTLHRLAEVARAQGDYARAAGQYAEALAVARQVGNQGLIAYIHYRLAELALAQGDYEQAARQFGEVLTLGRGTGAKPTIALALSGLAKMAQAQGDFPSALALQAEVLTIQRATGDRWEIAHALVSFAALAAEQHQAEPSPLQLESLRRAARLLGAAEDLQGLTQRTWFSVGFSVWRADSKHLAAEVRARLGETAFDNAWAEGRALSLQQAIDYALGR